MCEDRYEDRYIKNMSMGIGYYYGFHDVSFPEPNAMSPNKMLGIDKIEEVLNCKEEI